MVRTRPRKRPGPLQSSMIMRSHAPKPKNGATTSHRGPNRICLNNQILDPPSHHYRCQDPVVSVERRGIAIMLSSSILPTFCPCSKRATAIAVPFKSLIRFFIPCVYTSFWAEYMTGKRASGAQVQISELGPVLT
ncbi:MAG: hypothetical protein Q9177_003821 [Variospora cf. flavescens]